MFIFLSNSLYSKHSKNIFLKTINIICYSNTKKLSSVKMADSEIKRWDNITKSPNDSRLYRGLELSNKFKALLISDPKTDKSAAAITVRVGTMDDPKEIPGMAHFLEHMLFLGSKKYPEENEYQKFVTEHGGGSNAYTSECLTNFFFDINPEYLKEGLDRFGQFFLDPLFTESATEREINAVNSEHEKNIPVDAWRSSQVDKSTSKPGHPFNHFGTGNIVTLGENPKKNGIVLRDELIKFYDKWYSANIMCLTILGKESLDELESIVSELFGKIENKNVIPSNYEEHPYGPDQVKEQICLLPVRDIRSMKMIFPTPEVRHLYKSAPDYYLGHLIGHEGPGSLLSILREKQLCNKLSAGIQAHAFGFSFFIISVDLTETAVERVNEIVDLLFQYIKLVKEEGIQKWIFDENRKVDETTFRFNDKETPLSYAHTLASSLNNYPIEDVLSGRYLTSEFKPELIEWLLEKLNPDNLRIIVSAKAFEGLVTQTEEIYGAKYKRCKIPQEVIENWKNVDLSPNLKLPLPNEFIPEKFDLYSLENSASEYPEIIQDTFVSRVWFKQDNEYLLPKNNVTIEFFSPLTFMDPLRHILTSQFVSLLSDSLKEYSYAATLAGLEWTITNSRYGILLGISGYDEKIPVLLTKIMTKMVNFEVDPDRYTIIRETTIRGLKNFDAEQPHIHANTFISLILSEHDWSKAELLKTAEEETSLERLKLFIPELLSHVFIQVLIHGNCSKKNAMEITNIIEEPFRKSAGLFPLQLLQNRAVQLYDGCDLVYDAQHIFHSSSCVINYYQGNVESTSDNIIAELFLQMTNESCYNVLRTQEQLGYIVASGIKKMHGVLGFFVLVQSDKHPEYVNDRIEEFLRNLESSLKDMSDEEFNLNKAALATRRLEKPKQLSAKTARFWSEITTRKYNFDRTNIEVNYLSTVTKDQIVNYYKDLISRNSCIRRKLSVQVLSTVTNPEIPKKDEAVVERTKIEDIVTFKSSCSLFPLPKSYIDVSPIGTKSKL